MLFRRVLGVASIGCALFSLACVIAMIGFLTGDSPTDNDTAANLAALIFFVGTTAGFGWLARWGFSNPKPAPGEADHRPTQIRQILSLAKRSGGELTLMEVAAETTLSIEQSRELLEELVTQGIAQMNVDDEGVILYAFADFRRGTDSLRQQLPPG